MPVFWMRYFFLLCLLVCGSRSAYATQAYAQREGRACGYCHVSASPGLVNIKTGMREAVNVNKRGLYYSAHKYSFDGYVEPKAHSNLPPQLFRFVYKDALLGAARRIAVADVMGDNTPRLITLNEIPGNKDSSLLTVQKWDGKAFVTEFSAETPGAPDKLAVGRFTADGKIVIVTSRAAWRWNGSKFVSKTAAQTLNIMGSVRYRTDGSERILAANSPTDIRAFRVSLSGGEPFVDPVPAPSSAQVTQMEMRNTPDFFDKMTYPPQLTRGGILGLWTIAKANKSLLYHVDLDQDIDVQNDPTGKQKTKFVVKSQGWKVGVDDPFQRSLATHFTTERLAGDIYDVAGESAHGDHAPGLLILTSEGPDGKGRSLYFYALNQPNPNAAAIPDSR